jgi:hypothetical protein
MVYLDMNEIESETIGRSLPWLKVAFGDRNHNYTLKRIDLNTILCKDPESPTLMIFDQRGIAIGTKGLRQSIIKPWWNLFRPTVRTEKFCESLEEMVNRYRANTSVRFVAKITPQLPITEENIFSYNIIVYPLRNLESFDTMVAYLKSKREQEMRLFEMRLMASMKRY